MSPSHFIPSTPCAPARRTVVEVGQPDRVGGVLRCSWAGAADGERVGQQREAVARTALLRDPARDLPAVRTRCRPGRCCTASNMGGSTHGRLRASFLTRTRRSGRSGPSRQGQVTSYACSPLAVGDVGSEQACRAPVQRSRPATLRRPRRTRPGTIARSPWAPGPRRGARPASADAGCCVRPPRRAASAVEWAIASGLLVETGVRRPQGSSSRSWTSGVSPPSSASRSSCCQVLGDPPAGGWGPRRLPGGSCTRRRVGSMNWYTRRTSLAVADFTASMSGLPSAKVRRSSPPACRGSGRTGARSRRLRAPRCGASC